MADTLLDVVKRVLVATGQDPSVSAFSDNDDTNFIVNQINDARIRLRTLESQHIETNSTITVTAGTRTYSVTTGLDIFDIDQKSFRTTQGSLDFINVTDLQNIDINYLTTTGKQLQYIYFENNKIGVYPILEAGTSAVTVSFRHPSVYARLTATTDVFEYPDPIWVTFCERYAQMKYEVFKGIAQPAVTQGEVDVLWAQCVARSAGSKSFRMRGSRVYRH